MSETDPVISRDVIADEIRAICRKGKRPWLIVCGYKQFFQLAREKEASLYMTIPVMPGEYDGPTYMGIPIERTQEPQSRFVYDEEEVGQLKARKVIG